MSVKEKTEDALDKNLRPADWENFVGQNKVKRNIRVMIEAANKRGETVDHILFSGGPGLGKTTLSYLVAKASKSRFKNIAGPSLQRPGDLAAILTSLEERDVLFIDEIHRMNRICEEIIYPAIENFKLNILTGTGPMARSIDLELPRFTLIGATTRIGLLSSPLRSRFGATFQISLYDQKEIQEIIKQSAKILNIEITEQAVEKIANCSRFTPRVANRLLKRVRDFAQVKSNSIINLEVTQTALKELEVDSLGLEPQDRKILYTIIKRFQGGPVGLQALAAATSEEKDNILEVYEPYLMQLGLVQRTPQGRVATKKAYQHIKRFNGEN